MTEPTEDRKKAAIEILGRHEAAKWLRARAERLAAEARPMRLAYRDTALPRRVDLQRQGSGCNGRPDTNRSVFISE